MTKTLKIYFFKKSLIIITILSLITFNPIFTQANENIPFDKWLENIEMLAINKGIASETIEKSLTGVEPNNRVIELDRKQPEFTLTLESYLNNAAPKSRVKKGKDLYQEHQNLFEEIYEVYKVQPRFIIALWGIETNFGMYTGSFNVIRSLATLSHDLRRRDFFTDEMINALTIIDQGHIEPDEMMGSWAGAMGQNQFMPSSFLNYATDFNRDGKKDIWNTLPDVFASSSNYLNKSGWDHNQTWGREVKVSQKIDEDLITVSARKIVVSKKINEWSKLGVTNLDGSKLPDVNIDAYLVYPEGEEGRKYIVYENFKTIMKWNRSLFFGIAVGTLSDMIEYF
jgi:membrane-bound lytic murein transglycosylase B